MRGREEGNAYMNEPTNHPLLFTWTVLRFTSATQWMLPRLIDQTMKRTSSLALPNEDEVHESPLAVLLMTATHDDYMPWVPPSVTPPAVFVCPYLLVSINLLTIRLMVFSMPSSVSRVLSA